MQQAGPPQAWGISAAHRAVPAQRLTSQRNASVRPTRYWGFPKTVADDQKEQWVFPKVLPDGQKEQWGLPTTVLDGQKEQWVFPKVLPDGQKEQWVFPNNGPDRPTRYCPTPKYASAGQIA